MSLYKRIRSAREEYTATDGIDRSPGSIAEVDPLATAKDAVNLNKQQQKKASNIDIDTLEERRKARQAKQLEQRLKLVSDLQEAQRGIQEINQARISFFQMESQANINKTIIDQEINEIVGAGQAQAGLERAKGETAAEATQLKLAAQGQNLSGEGATAVARTQRILAATRAADARTNALSRAMGLGLEKIGIDRNVAYGRIQKSIATQSGITRAAYGIADAAIRFGGAGSGGAGATKGKGYTPTKKAKGLLDALKDRRNLKPGKLKETTEFGISERNYGRGPSSIRRKRDYWIRPLDFVE